MFMTVCFWALTSSVLCFPDQSLKGKGKVSVKVWRVIVMVMVPFNIMFPKVTLINLCVPKQVDRCEGWCLAQRSVGQSTVSKLKPVGTASSMESVPTYIRYYTDISRQRKRQVGVIVKFLILKKLKTTHFLIIGLHIKYFSFHWFLCSCYCYLHFKEVTMEKTKTTVSD